MANQVDFKIAPSDQFSVYSPSTRSEKTITYFTLLSKLRGDILAVSQEEDPNNIVAAYYSNEGGTQTLHLVKADGSEVTASNTYAGTVTSVDMSVPTGFAISGNPITSAGTLAVSFASGYSLPTDAIQATWTTAYNRSITSAAVTGTSTKTLTLNQQDGGTITATWSDIDTGLTSVGLTMPSAFAVANSPLTANGTIAVTGAGTAAQYVRGDGQLANFPASGGGGSTINYYLNGSVNQGTFGGTTYYEMSKNPIAGAGTNFTRTHAQGPGYIASFITDAGDPALLNIPGGNWNLVIYFNSSSNGGSPSFYGELYKVDSSNVFTLIASGSANPEVITNGTTVDEYFTSIAVPQTTLLVTDRLAIRIYVTPGGRNITMHTENSNFAEVITTFSTGLNALNGLTTQVQYFATGTSGTDFAINSVSDTHTFNLPTASSTNRGALSSTDWTTFNSKEPALTKGNLTESTSAVLTITGGTGAVIGTGTSIQVSQSSSTTSGYLSSTDWNTFNSKSGAAFKTISVSGQSDIVADTADDTLTIVAGTGVTLTTNATTDTLTITNAAPDQTVVLTAGTGITTSGTYPNFTITNSAPDQTVVLTAGTGISTSGTYPNFTITNSAPDQTVVLTGAGTTVVTGTYPSFTITSNDQYVGTVTSVDLTAGTGISVSGGPITTSGSITVNNTDRGSSQNIFKNIAVTGQSTIVADNNDDTLNVVAGTGVTITTNATTDTLTISATGSGGTVTSISTTAPITGGTITSTGTIGITQSSSTTDGYLSSMDWNTFNGKASNSFTIIAVSGQSNIVADSASDTLTIVAGDRIDITTTAASDTLTITHGSATGADFTTAEDFRDRVIADGGIFEALGEVAIAIGSLEDIASPASTDYSDGFVLQNIAVDEFGHVLGIGATDLDERYAQASFTSIEVSGYPTVSADSVSDTLTLAAGYGVSITTDHTTDTITIANTFEASYPVYTDSRNYVAVSSAYETTGSWDVITINGDDLEIPAIVDADGVYTAMMGFVTLGIENQGSRGFINLGIRLYNSTQAAIITDSTMTWTGYLDDYGFDTASTLFTYHVPIDLYVSAGDIIQVQVIDLNSSGPYVNVAKFSLVAKSAPI